MKTLVKNPLLKDLTLDWIQEFSSQRKEPSWLTNLRIEAFKGYQALPWPSIRDEKWKRAEIKLLSPENLSIGSASSEPIEIPSDIKAFSTESIEGRSEIAISFLNLSGGHAFYWPKEKISGIEWTPLDQAIQNKSSEVEAAWRFAIEKAKGNKFSLLNLALASTGSCLSISKNTQVKNPLVQIWGSTTPKMGTFVFNLILAEENTEAQFWEEMIQDSHGDKAETAFVSSYTYVHLKDNANISVTSLQEWNSNIVHFQFQDIEQASSSRFNAVAVQMGGRVFRNDSRIHLNGEGAENKILGVLFGDKQQNFENWITQNHNAKKTMSDIQYRGALKGSSKSFFSGLVAIIKEAQQSDAFQSCKSLILSKDAKADAIPNLEILADDVKCSHGAAVGPVDEDQKYYMQTRGISPSVAEEIIIQGFFEPVISAVPSASVQEKLRGFIEKKLGSL